MAQRISRKALKQDEFVDAAVDAGHWIERHWPKALLGAAAVGLVVLGTLGWLAWSQSRNAELEGELAAAITSYEKALAHVEGAASFDEVLPRFAVLAERGGRRPTGRVAEYYRGATLYRLGRNDEAIETLRGVLAASATPETLRAAARGLLARSLTAAGRTDEAIAVLDEALADESSRLPPQQVLLDLGRLHAAAGHDEQARASWQRVVDEFPATAAANDARQLLDAG